MVDSLRGRLTLTFLGVAGAAVFGAAAGMMLLIEHASWATVDAAIEEEAETLGAILQLGPVHDLARAVVTIGNEKDLGPGKFVRVIGGDGNELARSGAIPEAIGAIRPPGGRATRYTSVEWRGNPYRVVWYPIGADAWSEVGVRVDPQTRSLRRARLAIGASAAGLLAALAGLCWAITTRATEELERLAAELETIEAGSLHHRLAVRRTTEVTRLARVLDRLLTRLEGAMGHLRRFTADAAHELRTPIAGLRAHLEVAIGRPRSTETYRDGLLDALEQTERLGRLAEDLLTLSAVEAGIVGPGGGAEIVQLEMIAREVAESLEPVAHEERRAFACDAVRPVAVRGDPGLLKRLVLNLVGNAFRHTPSTAAVRLSVRAADGVATVEVSDRGPGIPPEDVSLVFEPFHRGRAATNGSGLGLTLCREIVARHRGDIALHSVPGAGTTVTVTIPLADSPR
jgi:signal transduction histidine kinase